jgi:Protein of unknown function (DUF4199)
MLSIKNPVAKGLITGLLMILTAYAYMKVKGDPDNTLQYLDKILFAGGIIWAILDYSRSPDYDGKFGSLFLNGFRCFVVIAFVMVLFTYFYAQFNEEYKRGMLKSITEQASKLKDKTPAEKETLIAGAKKYYWIQPVLAATFGYLIVGAIITALTSLLIIKKK